MLQPCPVRSSWATTSRRCLTDSFGAPRETTGSFDAKPYSKPGFFLALRFDFLDPFPWSRTTGPILPGCRGALLAKRSPRPARTATARSAAGAAVGERSRSSAPAAPEPTGIGSRCPGDSGRDASAISYPGSARVLQPGPRCGRGGGAAHLRTRRPAGCRSRGAVAQSSNCPAA
jgi:hypothetical protein